MSREIENLLIITLLGIPGILLIWVTWRLEWDGEVLDKIEVYERNIDGFRILRRKLIIRLNNGTLRTVYVGKKSYREANIGDFYAKTKKSFKPKKHKI